MKSPLLLSSVLALGLGAGALSLPYIANAADAPAAPAAMRTGDGGTMHGRHDGDFHRRFAGRKPFEHIDGRLAYIKAELKIAPEQEKAWAPFEAALRQQADTAKKKFEERRAAHEKAEEKDMRAPLTVPERFARTEQRLQAGLTAVENIKAPTLALYNALSPEQKAVADNLLPGPSFHFAR